RLWRAIHVRRTWVPVIYKGYAVPHENLRLDGDSFTNKGMALYLATRPYFYPLLYLDECSDPCFVTYLAAVKIHKIPNTNIAPQLYIRSNLLVSSLFRHVKSLSPRAAALAGSP